MLRFPLEGINKVLNRLLQDGELESVKYHHNLNNIVLICLVSNPESSFLWFIDGYNLSFGVYMEVNGNAVRTELESKRLIRLDDSLGTPCLYIKLDLLYWIFESVSGSRMLDERLVRNEVYAHFFE